MATFVKGILGGFSGKVGTVIGACWKGIDYMRSIAANVTDAKTAAQLDQRAKFSAVIKFLRPLTAFLRFSFKSQAIRMSAFNAALAYNLKNAILGIYPGYEIDYEAALVSCGSLPGALNPTAESVVAAKVAFTWEDNSLDADTKADDKVILLVYNPAKNQAINVVGTQTRADGMQVLSLPASFSGDNVECYISFIQNEGSEVSNSLWVASLLVA